MLEGKRGILLKETLYLILAIVIIVILLTLAYNSYQLIKVDKEKNQAFGSLERLQITLNNLQKGWTDDFIGYAPVNWWLVSYANDSGIVECGGQACVCICEEENCSNVKYCKPIQKELREVDSGELVKTGLVSSLTITDIETIYEATVRSYPSGYKSFTPSNNIWDKYLAKEAPALAGLGGCIVETATITRVPIVFIMSVAIHESNGGTTNLSKESCLAGPDQFSNNLFGVKYRGSELADKGYCNWPTPECLDESGFVTEDIISECIPKDYIACEVGKTCYFVNARFQSYNDKCESIKHFAETIIMGNPERKEAVEKYRNDINGLAKAIGETGYATDPKWVEKVISVSKKIVV